MRGRELFSDALEGLIKTQTRFDAHNQEIEHVGRERRIRCCRFFASRPSAMLGSR